MPASAGIFKDYFMSKNFKSFLGDLYSRLNNKSSEVGINDLANALSTNINLLNQISLRYSKYEIPKRSGGMRKLEIPSEELKVIQNKIYHRLIKNLKAHPCATGFLTGKSIVHNATMHTGKKVIIKLDIKNFFTNTRIEAVNSFFKRLGWNDEASQMLAKLTTNHGHLPQGACTSPSLSNLVNYRMDLRLNALAKKYQCDYSRYADDMTFSMDYDDRKTICKIKKKVKYILKLNGYRLNHKKTRVFRSFQKQLVTGLVVNNKVSVPRSTKRLIRSIEHRYKMRDHARKPTMTKTQLEGLKSFVAMVEKQSRDNPNSES